MVERTDPPKSLAALRLPTGHRSFPPNRTRDLPVVQARNWASGPLRATLGIFWELLLARRRERRSAAQSPIALRNSLQNVLDWANVLLGRRSDRIGVSGRRTAMIDGSSAWIAETRHGISGLRTANRLATIFSRIEMNAGTTSKALARIARAGVIKIEKTGSSIERIYGNIAAIGLRKFGTIPVTFTTTSLTIAGGEHMAGLATTPRTTGGGGLLPPSGRWPLLLTESRLTPSISIMA